jgi:hypothetical protein
VVRPDPCLPPPNSQYVATLAPLHQQYGTQYLMRNPKHKRFAGCQPPPPPGGEPQTHSFGSVVEAEFSSDGGQTWMPIAANAQTAIVVSSAGGEGDTRYFDTEMVQLNMSGGGLPPNVMIRESPTLRSTGVTSIRAVGGSGTPDGGVAIGYEINSFFDVFTELSIDGGLTWAPSAMAGHVEVEDEPAPCVRNVVGRGLTFNNSAWDGNTPGFGGAIEASAVVPGKTPLLPGQNGGGSQASFSNFVKGVTGMYIDVAASSTACPPLSGPMTAADIAATFAFSQAGRTTPGEGTLLSDYSPIPTPPVAVHAVAGAGAGGSDRIFICLPDNFSANASWLRVVVRSTANGGTLNLTGNDVFYWGLAKCRANPAGVAAGGVVTVGIIDVNQVKANPRAAGTALITDIWDVDRNKAVGIIDANQTAANPLSTGNGLKMITVP